jgi:hypothetical protein
MCAVMPIARSADDRERLGERAPAAPPVALWTASPIEKFLDVSRASCYAFPVQTVVFVMFTLLLLIAATADARAHLPGLVADAATLDPPHDSRGLCYRP